MKKLFLFVMIILPAALLSQTVSGLKVETVAGSASTVTFNVSWDKATLTTPWLDSMWVFVDYNKNGRMERLLISGGTLTEHTATKPGTGIFIPENDMGAWVYGDARTNTAGSFSAKVELYTKETDIIIAGACAYASSYPPVGKYISEMEIVFTGTPMYEIKLLHEDGFTVETIESGGTFLLPCSYTVSSFTDATGAPGIIQCLAPTGLSLTASPETICAGAPVTLTASATDAASYSLDGTNWQTEMAFEVTPTSTTHYTLYAQTAEGCVAILPNAAVVTVSVLSPGEIGNGVTSITAGAIPPNVTITNITAATSGSGNITYQWRRTGTSSAILTGSAAAYAIGNNVTNYGTAGTYYFNRYVKDAMCTWVAAAGTFTLNVEPGTITLCSKCCYTSSSTVSPVDCYVTTHAYPFVTSSGYSKVTWIGGSSTYLPGARSPYDGRANTNAIKTAGFTSTSGAVGICLSLGTGWYLPAYEELENMSTGANSSYRPYSGCYAAGTCPNLLANPNQQYWSSTEYTRNGGRQSEDTENFSNRVVCTYSTGGITYDPKTSIEPVRCVWRP
jgi:hypothetical protein